MILQRTLKGIPVQGSWEMSPCHCVLIVLLFRFFTSTHWNKVMCHVPWEQSWRGTPCNFQTFCKMNGWTWKAWTMMKERLDMPSNATNDIYVLSLMIMYLYKKYYPAIICRSAIYVYFHSTSTNSGIFCFIGYPDQPMVCSKASHALGVISPIHISNTH